MPTSQIKPYDSNTLIKELKFNDRTIYKDNFNNKPKTPSAASVKGSRIQNKS